MSKATELSTAVDAAISLIQSQASKLASVTPDADVQAQIDKLNVATQPPQQQ